MALDGGAFGLVLLADRPEVRVVGHFGRSQRPTSSRSWKGRGKVSQTIAHRSRRSSTTIRLSFLFARSGNPRREHKVRGLSGSRPFVGSATAQRRAPVTRGPAEETEATQPCSSWARDVGSMQALGGRVRSARYEGALSGYTPFLLLVPAGITSELGNQPRHPPLLRSQRRPEVSAVKKVDRPVLYRGHTVWRLSRPRSSAAPSTVRRRSPAPSSRLPAVAGSVNSSATVSATVVETAVLAGTANCTATVTGLSAGPASAAARQPQRTA